MWKHITVHQPKAINRYNKYLNGVDQLIGTNKYIIACDGGRLFFHLFDIAAVNGFMLFSEHQANYPDDEALQRPKDYSVTDFRNELEIIRYQ